MTVRTGPLALALPDWGLEAGRVTGFVATGGNPEILVAQMLLGAAVASVRTLVLLPGPRDRDPVWRRVAALLSDGGEREAARALAHIPLQVYAMGAGRELLGSADLVYAAGLTGRELEGFRAQTSAALVTVGQDGADEVVEVGAERLTVSSIGATVPVALDLGGSIYLATC